MNMPSTTAGAPPGAERERRGGRDPGDVARADRAGQYLTARLQPTPREHV